MSAIFMDGSYTSRSESDTNVSKAKRISALVSDMLKSNAEGSYSVTWGIRDGTIQDISSSRKVASNACQFSRHDIYVDMEKAISALHKETLVVSFHGSAAILWTVDWCGQAIIETMVEKNLR